MAKPRIIYNNLWRKGTALAASPAADPQHPVSDTQIDTLSMYFKASAATSPCYIPLDLGAGAGAVNFLAILGHTIPSGTTVTFEHDDDGDTFPSATPVAIDYNPLNMYQFFTAFTEQYVRVKLVKAGGFGSAPQVATVLCGSYFELNRSERPGYERGHEDPSVIEESDELIIFTQEKPRIEIGSFPFVGISDAVRATILSFIEEVGIHKAFVLCFDYSDANNESMWVRNSEVTIPKWMGSENHWAWELRVREIK